MAKSLALLAAELAAGRETAEALTARALERIEASEGEGRLAFLNVHREKALKAAAAMDQLRGAGLAPSPYAGIPISVKDLFDLAGEPTTAGSIVLKDFPPAQSDAVAIARLRRAGFIVVGRTNMTEFAFSGIGINPHYGTPACPYDRGARRIPGGSSSGAAVSVADGMVYGAAGSDTGGSCRIPAALCGIVGYKPTAARVPLKGAFPLSSTLDSIGPLANTVNCCRVLDRFMSGEELSETAPRPLSGIRLATPKTLVLDNLDGHVAPAFERALTTLSRAGARIDEIPLAMLSTLAGINSKGGFAAAEAYARHRALLAEGSAQYDPRVLFRIMRGEQQSSADYIALIEARNAFIAAVNAEIVPYDALVMPTVPVIAPLISELEHDGNAFTRANMLMLQNPAVVNMMDGCAISLPMHRGGEPPAGLMLAASGGRDAALFSVAAVVEAWLDPRE